MKTKSLLLAFAGLGLFACSNEEINNNGLPEGDGAVRIKIVSPAGSRAVTAGSPDNNITVTGDITVSLTADFGNGSETKTITLTGDDKEANFWNVQGKPTKVTVSMNGGVSEYNTNKYLISNDKNSDAQDGNEGTVNMQATAKIPVYGEETNFTYSGAIASPDAGDIADGTNTGAQKGDDDKQFFMYEATVTPAIPVARLEVSNISHKVHTDTDGDNCEYSKLTITGVYMDHIKPLQNGSFTDYKFPGDNGETATGADAILSDKIGDSGEDFLADGKSWPADLAEGENKEQVFAYNFYADAALTDGKVNVQQNPQFKIYFAEAKEVEGADPKASPRYAMITKYIDKTTQQEIQLLAGNVYRITDVQLEDKNIIGNEDGQKEVWGVAVTVTLAKWTVQDISAEWAE